MKSPFDFDISAASDKKRRQSRSRRSSGAFEHSNRQCEHEGCENPGKYRAPRSQNDMENYRWFCLDHVREYNAKWNFFEEASIDDIEEQYARDAVGDRPTRPINSDEAKAWARMGFSDPYEVLRDKATQRRAGENARAKLLPKNEQKALEILGGTIEHSHMELRKLYKSLVKDLHPDRNAGSRADEERLNEVVWAWDQIKISRNFKAK